MSRKIAKNKHNYTLYIAMALQLSGDPSLANGLITLDGSVGTGAYRGVPTPLSGANNAAPVNVTQDMGTTLGRNLFHSFSDFNINTGQTVTFTGNNALNNVISRVTGTNPSVIDGKLASTIGQADFYFINPNGVTFNANAKIEVPGSFHVSTANKLNFKDGGSFSANLNQSSTLTDATPASFGFLATNSTNNGLIRVSAANPIIVNVGKSLDFVAGNIKLEQSGGAKLVADGGEIRLVAKKNGGLVSLERDQFGNLLLPKVKPTRLNAGKISISGGGPNQYELDVTNYSEEAKGGRIALWGGATSITDAKIKADIQRADSQPSRGNNIEIHANTLKIANTPISSDVVDSPTPGNVFVQTTGNMSLLRGGQITASSFGKGNGGLVTVNVGGNLRIYGMAGVPNAIETGVLNKSLAAGDAGNINVNVGKQLYILNGGQISSDSIGIGDSGDVTVRAGKGITIDAVKTHPFGDPKFCKKCLAPENFTGISSDVVGGDADGGDVVVDSKGSIELRNAGWISTFNTGLGDSGSLDIKFDGSLTLENSAAIKTDAEQTGNGGGIAIKGNGFVSLKDSWIITSAGGSGGDIQIKADSLVMKTGLIEANALNGNGGRVTLDIRALISSGNTVNGLDITSGNFLQEGRSLVWDAGEFANNIIRAFSQNGVNGPIDLGTANLNLSATLANLGGPQFDTSEISRDYCATGTGSSLTRHGKGGLPPKGGNLIQYSY